MIKKLQRKFIMITMGSLALVMLILIGSINGINLYRTNNEINGVIKMLSDNQGQFPMFENEKEPLKEPILGFQMNAETPFQTRYFVVKTDEKGSIIEIDTGHIKAVTPADAVTYVKSIQKDNKTSGYYGMYKYAVVKETEDITMSIFVDASREIQTATGFLIISCVVALICLVLMFILVSVFSKKAINPIIENMEKQKQFITDAGHEIKTPITIISANADVLEIMGGENEWITSIRNQTTRMDKLVKNMLSLAKIDEGNIQLNMGDFDLSRTIYDAAKPFQTIAQTQEKEFRLDIQSGLKLNGDEGSIHQLVSTLVDNALKYSNENGRIRISLSTVKKGGKTGIKLEVFNTTDQLENVSVDKLFDRFYRADNSRSRETGGYGIGLSIAQSIVEAHRGKIFAKSEDGKSISFTVLL